ncbi:MAG: hypothetical protein IJ795_00855 [Bacteroidales bacterium]|nr:hypothetical protein [Bacteroidales bacterium]
MKYIVRAIKYYIYYWLLLAVLLGILVLFKFVDSNPEAMFRHGYDSFWQIGLMFGVVALAYPFFGFKKYGIALPGEYKDLRPGILEVMEGRGYELETEDGENMTFRLRNKFNRLTRMLEDRVTLERDLHGFMIEGPNRDVVRLKNAIEYKFREE